jgi:hypothetical protein
VKLLAAIAAVSAAAPFTARAQTPPPSISVEATPSPTAPATLDPLDGVIDLSAYPAAQRDAIWERYGRKNHINVNILYPMGGLIMTTVVTGFRTSMGLQGQGAISVPFEYERCLNRGMSVFGVLQPEASFDQGETKHTLAVGAGGRAYFTGTAPDGFWMGVHASSVLPVDSVTMRIESGYNGVFANGLTASFGMGAGLTHSSTATIPFSSDPMPWLPAFGIRFTVGYAF